MEPLLEVVDLRTIFLSGADTIEAVDGVSFTVGVGEIVGLVGESGSGKSATAQSILRLLPPNGRITSGEIRLEGRDLLRLGPEEMRQVRGGVVSLVMQDALTALNPVLPIGEQVADVLEAHATVRRQDAWRQASTILQRVEIRDVASTMRRFAHQLSGGMQQRTQIAAALIASPKLVIADEPTTALDVTVQQQILALLYEVRRQSGTAVMFISHDLATVASLCDRVLIMYAGQIVESGPTDELFAHPRHPYTQGLIASIPSFELFPPDMLQAIPGSPPNPARLPVGCRFAERCPFVREACLADGPPMVDLGGKHHARCILYTGATDATAH